MKSIFDIVGRINFKDVLIIVLPILTAFFSINMTKNKDLELKTTEEKIRRYERIISYLKNGFMGSTLSNEDKHLNKMKYYEETYVVWLYASDEVILSINEFAFDFAIYSKTPSIDSEKKVQLTAGKLLLAMRNDTRGKTKLKETDFISTEVFH